MDMHTIENKFSWTCYVFIFLFCYICFFAVDSAVCETIKKSFVGGEMKELVDPYMMFSFAGKEVCPFFSPVWLNFLIFLCFKTIWSQKLCTNMNQNVYMYM